MRNTRTFISVIFAGFSCIAGATEGMFAQFDKGVGGGTAVVATEIEQMQVSAAYSQWSSSGKSLSGGLLKNVYLNSSSTNTFKLNAGVGVVNHHSDPSASSPSASAAGVKLGVEDYQKWQVGSVFAMAEYNTAFKSWLGVVQIQPANSPLGFEWSAVGDDRWYVGHKVALTWKFGNSPWSLRVGQQLKDSTNFIGITYNTF